MGNRTRGHGAEAALNGVVLPRGDGHGNPPPILAGREFMGSMVSRPQEFHLWQAGAS